MKDFVFYLIFNLQGSVYGFHFKQFTSVELTGRKMDIKNGIMRQSLSRKYSSRIRLQLSLSDFILALIRVLLMNLGGIRDFYLFSYNYHMIIIVSIALCHHIQANIWNAIPVN